MAAVPLLLTATSCTSLADRIAVPRSTSFMSQAEQASFERHMGVERHATNVSPGATLSWWLVPPAARDFRYGYMRAEGGARFEMQAHGEDKARPLRARGTVLFLHGWNMDATAMLPWALALAEHGYLGIAVDLRGHGDSSDVPVGYGTREAEDIDRLLAALGEDGKLVAPVYLFGVSYGAATALLAEPVVDDQVSGIIAMAPYANAGEAVRTTVRQVLDRRGSSLRSRLLLAGARMSHGAGDEIDRAIDDAGTRLGLTLDDIDLGGVVSESGTCTLLLHGAKDKLVPSAGSRRLSEESTLVRYHEIQDATHVTLPMRLDLLADPIAEWLDSVSGGSCPGLGQTGKQSPL